MRWALGVEYDGAAYCGWQSQKNGVGVQAVVENAVGRVADHAVSLVCAGRTDAGVHSSGQVAHFDTEAVREAHAWVLGANTYLPDDVSVAWARSVPDDFHARYSAVSRSYVYLILNRRVRSAVAHDHYVWQHRDLDAGRMREGALNLAGEHDFSAFRASDCQAKTAVRCITNIDVRRHDDVIALSITANAFLKHMVRNIAGVLLKVGTGDREPEWTRSVLESRDRTQGGVTAPARGLYLVAVAYPDVFDIPAPASLPLAP